jgi:hypothetical protein
MPARERPSKLLVVMPIDRLPGIPGDLEDDECDHKSDDRVGDLRAETDNRRTGDDTERDECVDAGMVAVCRQRWAVKSLPSPEPNPGGDLVAHETDDTCGREKPQMR